MAGDIKAKYAASAAYTITLNSLASSATLVAGRESTKIDNTTQLALDFIVAGKIKAGTTPTAGQVSVFVTGSLNDTPDLPDLGSGTQLTGVDAAATWASASVLQGGAAPWATATTETTTGRVSPFKAMGIASLFAGPLPKFHGLYIAHSMVAALDATAGGSFWYTPVLEQYT